MIIKVIKIAELFGLIDEWFDKKKNPFVIVEDENGIILSGEVEIPNVSSYYLPQNRPCHILINNQPINLITIKSLEVADVKFEVVK